MNHQAIICWHAEAPIDTVHRHRLRAFSPRARRSRRAVVAFTFLALNTLLSCLITFPAKADSNALLHIMQDCIVKGEAAKVPCKMVNAPDGYVILKDIRGKTQFLLIPTAVLTGIESPDLATAPNYFAAAWKERGFVDELASPGLRPDESRIDERPGSIVLALNSQDRRSQNQFHIHLDLARAGLRDALAAHVDDPLNTWSTIRFRDVDYHLMRLKDLSQDPIKLVQARLSSQAEMAHQTIALTNAVGKDAVSTFFLLDGSYDKMVPCSGAAEVLEIQHLAKECE